MQQRGQLTDRVQSKAKQLLGREISVTELRLMPYIAYTMVNNQKIDYAKVSYDECDILESWSDNGYIEQHDDKLTVTEEFWNAINQILYVAYVDLNSAGSA